MKRHSPFPHGKYLERMGHILRQLIKENVSESPAKYHAQGNGEYQVAHVIPAQGDLSSLHFSVDDEIGGDKPYDIHEAIPAKLESPQSEKYRVDIWKLHR